MDWFLCDRDLRKKRVKCQCCPYLETNLLICCANQSTGFYMRATLAFKDLLPT